MKYFLPHIDDPEYLSQSPIEHVEQDQWKELVIYWTDEDVQMMMEGTDQSTLDILLESRPRAKGIEDDDTLDLHTHFTRELSKKPELERNKDFKKPHGWAVGRVVHAATWAAYMQGKALSIGDWRMPKCALLVVGCAQGCAGSHACTRIYRTVVHTRWACRTATMHAGQGRVHKGHECPQGQFPSLVAHGWLLLAPPPIKTVRASSPTYGSSGGGLSFALGKRFSVAKLRPQLLVASGCLILSPEIQVSTGKELLIPRGRAGLEASCLLPISPHFNNKVSFLRSSPYQSRGFRSFL
ncbi:hypothetical protein Salat_1450700 [Sesamum alatum]|uniref:Uncharacterized protein n=1 Tax=Sesamum alatum TaxID=300844 RepID=A0AAE1YAV1_9LAMI|nr:hypothetical protein Salat_1450700 [Sesamum alatum]